ncbi:MAG: sulfate/molybdate ABC transporter ATP-binding protein [Roseateles asaccharophilus]|uniref:Sulfate transport system ATP-binding protein n=1 Tax=Roseateles asaccharophilus TaxID=582607 RepID=A0A4R6NBP8_9BURK|nr:sulfate ABC transporter ATP-binding protein [Roseateles asaccharophilus]MDN3543254.1 sulfate ABC transporter ATP-binding protein [Roseateles asaccharophilus]TDP13048.1 sulfate transport system ATP-binding protein [Roseateles asaccharophilus]
MSIQVRNVHKSFGSFTALGDVSLDFPTGELVALLGPSGCGKTTLLRIIAGLETADRGQVLLDGEDASDTHVRERQVGFVFQHYALFRHMTVFDNVAFGLRVKPRKQRPSEAVIRKKVHELLNLVQLDWLADRFPPQLSGGQRQRIALARALAVEPRVLLLDEPFGALDAKVRKELRRWLRRLHDELHITSVFVTHDQEEALEVADRVVLMDHGKVEQVGTPAEVYERPATPFVYGFLGAVNRFEHAEEIGQLGHGAGAAGPVLAYARPHELQIITDPAAAGLAARVERVLSFGAASRVELSAADGRHLEAELSREQAAALNLQSGQAVRLSASRLSLFEHKVQAA